jgi:hypothetical protein
VVLERCAADSRAIDPQAPVDVLVSPETTAQQLIDVLVALDAAGVRRSGRGRCRNTSAAAPQGKHVHGHDHVTV